MQTATFTKRNAINGPLLFTYTDPTVAGTLSSTINGTTASAVFVGIAEGSTIATAIDASGATGAITLQSGPCGRPDEMTQYPILLSPSPGATGVPTSVGAAYFAVYTTGTQAPTDIQLHVIVGQNEAFEAGTLETASLPAGVPTAPPPNGPAAFTTLTYQTATLPTLNSETTYRLQLHDNACSPPYLTGSFATGK